MPSVRPASCLVVIPESRVRLDCVEAFPALAQDDASRSVADEPGCRRFDVVQVEEEPRRIIFYEVYDDRDAYEAHLRTTHPAAAGLACRP